MSSLRVTPRAKLCAAFTAVALAGAASIALHYGAGCMSGRSESRSQQLVRVEGQLAAHPYNSPEARLTREITDTYREDGVERINAELAAHGLPDLAESGKVVARGLWSYARLERKKRLLQRKTARTRR